MKTTETKKITETLQSMDDTLKRMEIILKKMENQQRFEFEENMHKEHNVMRTFAF